MRRAECAGLKVLDIDLDHDVAIVMGTGRVAVPAVRAQDGAGAGPLPPRWAKHHHAHAAWLWLGQKGRLTDTGILQMLRRRAAQAGLEHVYVDSRHRRRKPAAPLPREKPGACWGIRDEKGSAWVCPGSRAAG
jgi:hypothetical protein